MQKTKQKTGNSSGPKVGITTLLKKEQSNISLALDMYIATFGANESSPLVENTILDIIGKHLTLKEEVIRPAIRSLSKEQLLANDGIYSLTTLDFEHECLKHLISLVENSADDGAESVRAAMALLRIHTQLYFNIEETGSFPLIKKYCDNKALANSYAAASANFPI